MPTPEGKASRPRTGGGFQVSNNRNRQNAASQLLQFSDAAPANVIHCPRTSSTTTMPGSLDWLRRAVTPADQIAAGSATSASAAKCQGRQPAASAKTYAIANAASDPAVPGAMGK